MSANEARVLIQVICRAMHGPDTEFLAFAPMPLHIVFEKLIGFKPHELLFTKTSAAIIQKQTDSKRVRVRVQGPEMDGSMFEMYCEKERDRTLADVFNGVDVIHCVIGGVDVQYFSLKIGNLKWMMAMHESSASAPLPPLDSKPREGSKTLDSKPRLPSAQPEPSQKPAASLNTDMKKKKPSDKPSDAHTARVSSASAPLPPAPQSHQRPVVDSSLKVAKAPVLLALTQPDAAHLAASGSKAVHGSQLTLKQPAVGVAGALVAGAAVPPSTTELQQRWRDKLPSFHTALPPLPALPSLASAKPKPPAPAADIKPPVVKVAPPSPVYP